MESAQERYQNLLEVFKKAVASLEEVLQMPYSTLVRDATIQRFEYTIELSWKTLRAALAYSTGEDPKTPKGAIRKAYQEGLIPDPDPWFQCLEARNETSHTYDEEVAEKVFQQAKRLLDLSKTVLSKLRNIVP